MSASAPSTVGAQFGVPPYTDEFEGPDNNTGLTTQILRSAQQEIVGVTPFKQTDVIYFWIHEISYSYTITKGADTVTQSPYYPWSTVGPYNLNMQQQYPAISVASLIDLVFVTLTRPMANAQQGAMQWYMPGTLGTRPASGPAAVASGNPFLWPYWSQTPLVNVENTYVDAASVSLTLPILLPGCVYFDAYWEMTYDGMPASGPHNGYVSPQDMAGYARVVTPDLFFNQFVTTSTGILDSATFLDSAAAAVFAGGLVTHRFQRIGVLGNTDPSVLPGPTNWQYNIAHQRFPLAGRNSIDIQLNAVFLGQIMGVFCRFFDPSSVSPAAAGGNPIPLGNITKVLLQYGGNSIRFQGLAQDVQRWFIEKHRFLPPEGMFCLDLATDRQGWTSNAYLLNTLREAGVVLHLDFTATQSLTAYVEVVIDGLRWVPLTPVVTR